jgi:hypothetical protein
MSFTREGGDDRRRELVIGELFGLRVSTTVFPTAMRVKCTRRVSRWSADTGSPATMAERRRYSSATRGYRPRQGTRVRARAPWCEDDHGAQDRREIGRKGAPAMHGRERRPWHRGGGEAQMGLTDARTAMGARAREGGRRGGATRKVNQGMAVRWRSTTPAGDATGGGGVSSRSAFPKQRERGGGME